MFDFDDDALRCSLVDGEYGGSTENCGSHVPTPYAAILIF